jgi:lincosamide nucleotidyltransferase A/C/D/E
MPAIRLPIGTDRLVIRPLRPDDAADLHELYSDREAMRFLDSRLPATVAESRGWVQTKIDRFERDGGMSLWAVLERESGRVIGDAGLQWEEIEGRRELDLACRIVRRCQRRGYGIEASWEILRAAFSAGFTRITAQTDVGNAAARGLLERLGFLVTGETHWNGHLMAFYLCEQPCMSEADVVEALDALAGLRFWLDGGWGVDALVGEQTRVHRDLDLALDERHLAEAAARLEAVGYREVEQGWVGRPTRVPMHDGHGRWLDVHPLAFDDGGDGWQTLPGGELACYPAADFAGGTIAGRTVPCISPRLQAAHREGYTLADHDRADLALLHKLAAAT